MELKNQTKPVIYVTVPMPEQLEKELRLVAASLRVSRAELARQAISAFLADLRSPKKLDLANGLCDAFDIEHIGELGND